MKPALLLHLLAILWSGPLGFSAAHVTYWNQIPGKSWDDPTIWSPNDGSPPHPGDTYEVAWLSFTPQSTVQNPVNGDDVVFGGDSLNIRSGADVNLYAKAPGADTKITFGRAGLLLNDGNLRAREDVTFTIDGLISFTYGFNYLWAREVSAGRVVNLGSFRIDAELRGDQAYLVLAGGETNSPTFDFTNNNVAFGGTLYVLAGWLQLSGPGSLGSGSVSLTASGDGTGRFIPGILDADYDIVTPGTLTLNGPGQGLIRLDQHLTFNRISIGRDVLAPGTYTAEELIARYPENFAPIGQGSTVSGRLTTPVPEIGAATALIFGGFAFAVRRRRRRR